ncbi:RDD family protein [Bacteriovorax sp. DB6_IX]|uniref:RDD family protein n=1 Tax=Bacteriovorax sp. DB6_IX TaxID=1353530 RepID=UPI00038A1990|nr:RDD family protein [Bacteriovorax sp. DB6_IX]EQC52784.1 RDD family protein [Bacteriovorax sp. DB6_IX]
MNQATGFRRLIAFFIDFLLAWFVSYFFLSQEGIHRILMEYSFYQNLAQLQHKHLALTLIGLFLYRFYSGLFFASSLGMLLSGLKIQGHNALQVRVSMAFRALIMPLLFILTPLDHILAEYKKARISEVMTGTILLRRGGIFTLALGCITLVVSFALAYSGPLLYKSSFLFNPSVSFTPKVEIPLDKGRDFNLFRTYGSKSFQMMTFTDLESGRFKVNPSFEIRRTNGKVIYRPLMSIWDSTLGVKGVFKINKRFDFVKLLNKVKSNYPMFGLYYPNLDEDLSNAQMIGDGYELSDMARQELFELVSISLLANPFSIKEFVKKKRLFIFPYVVLKRDLFNLIGHHDKLEVDFVNRGSEVFLRTLNNDDFKGELKERFFSLKQLRPIVYENIWQNQRWVRKVNDTFSRTFYYKSKWGSVVDKEAAVWEKEYIFNPLSIHDFLGYKDFSPEGLLKFENYLKRYYRDEAMDSFRLGDQYQRLFLASMQRVFITWQLMMKRERIPYRKSTIKNFSDMMRALKSKNKDFFIGE